MTTQLNLEPLTAEAFAPFGEVLALKETADKLINQGNCERHHDLAKMDFSDGRAGISFFKGKPYELPCKLDMVERHPDGSQAFIPMSWHEFVVVVAEDDDGKPGALKAFITAPGQGVNYHRNVWHGVLTPLHSPGLFAVVDRIGDGPNLEEHWFDHEIVLNRS